MLYLYLKAFHIISIVAWFAGLLYLPRLLAYHAASDDDKVRGQLALMERRLYRFIMNPAVAAVFILGFTLLYLNPSVASNGWLHIKLLLVFCLLAYHIVCGRYLRSFASGTNNRSPRFFRLFNEIPTIFLIIIVLLAVTKPF